MIQNGIVLLVLLAIVAGGIYWLWQSGKPKVKRSHVYRIDRSKGVLEKLAEIGVNNPARIIGYLRKVDALVFEELLLTALEKRGFKVGRNARYTGDGGLDGRFWDNVGHEYLIQAKRYSSFISRKHVSEFAVLVESMGEVKGGLFIHTGRTPSELIKSMRESGITIISGEKLIDLLLKDSPVLVYPRLERIR